MTGSPLRTACALGLATALMILPAAGQTRPGAARSPCSQEAWPDRLEGIDPHGDLVLGSGRLAKLAGIRLPDASPARDGALAWLRDRTGQPILAQGGPGLDRWGRASLRIRLADGADPVDFGRGLV